MDLKKMEISILNLKRNKAKTVFFIQDFRWSPEEDLREILFWEPRKFAIIISVNYHVLLVKYFSNKLTLFEHYYDSTLKVRLVMVGFMTGK